MLRGSTKQVYKKYYPLGAII